MVAVPPAAASGATPLGRYVTQLQDQRERHEVTACCMSRRPGRDCSYTCLASSTMPRSASPTDPPRAGTLLERLWPALQDQFPAQPMPVTSTAAPPQDSIVPIAVTRERLSAHWRLPQLPPAPQPLMLPIAAYEAAQTDAGDAVERAVCEVLRGLARRRRLPDHATEALQQQLAIRLQRLGCAPERIAPLAAQGLGMVLACLDEARLQWIFAGLSAADAQAEVRWP